MWRSIDLANSITLVSLTSGFLATILAVESRFAWSLMALIFSGVCDLFDGLIARRAKRSELQRQVGARLDSLADVCSFGLAPVVILYSFGMNRPYEVFALATMLIATVMRVAYFDVVGLDESDGSNNKYYRGLPCTYVALVIPLAILLPAVLGVARAAPLLACVIVLSIAMTLPIRILKPRGLAYMGFALLAASVGTVLALYPTLIVELSQI